MIDAGLGLRPGAEGAKGLSPVVSTLGDLSAEGATGLKPGVERNPRSATEALDWTRIGEQSIPVCPSLRTEMGKGGDYETVEANHRRTKKHGTKA